MIGTHLEAVVEVASKELVAHHLGQLRLVAAMSRTSMGIVRVPPNRSKPSPGAPAAVWAAVERNVADFVQKQGAPMRHLEAAQFLSRAPVKAPFS